MSVEATVQDGNGIYTLRNGITINGGKVTATGKNYGILSLGGDVVIKDGTVTVAGKNGIQGKPNVTIEGGTVEATGAGDHASVIYAYESVSITGCTVEAIGTGEGSTGIAAADGSMTIKDATVTATGASYGLRPKKGASFTDSSATVTGQTGIYSSDGAVSVNGGEVVIAGTGETGTGISAPYGTTIEEGSKVTVVGASCAVYSSPLTNKLAGLGWTNVEGTAGKADIAIGDHLNPAYKKVQFPAPIAEVTKAPTAKDLTYSGSAQELVNAGTATGGTMQYVIGTDATTAPTTGWEEAVPKGTEAGTYHVWYKAAGDVSHSDSESKCVDAAIAAVIPVESVTLDKTSATLNVGENLLLKATVKPEDATGADVNWDSSDLSIAEVDGAGIVTAVAPGTATITATAGGKSAACAVTVVAPAPNPQPEPQPQPEPAADGVEMHRLYNPYTGEHFYTGDASERDTLVPLGWVYEGVGWTAPSESGDPVYRLYNPYAGDHHYTTSAEERDALVLLGWVDEGTGWLSAGEGGVPLYRQYNPYAETGTHNYTADIGENDVLVSVGWIAEGIGWYGVAPAAAEGTALTAASL